MRDANCTRCSVGLRPTPGKRKVGRRPTLHGLPQRQSAQLLQRDSQHRSEGETGRKTMRDSYAGAYELEEIERRTAARQDVQKLAREVLAIVDVEVQRLEVVAEMHLPQGGNAAREFGQGHAQLEAPEDPVLLRELAAPVVFFVGREMFETHVSGRAP